MAEGLSSHCWCNHWRQAPTPSPTPNLGGFSSEEECKEEAARRPRHTNPNCRRAQDGTFHLYLNHDLLTVPGSNVAQTFNTEEDGRQNIQWGIAGRPEETNPTLVRGGREGEIWNIYVIHQPTRQDDINQQTQPLDLSCKPGSSRDYDNYDDYLGLGLGLSLALATLPPCTTTQPPVTTTKCVSSFFHSCIVDELKKKK